MFKSIVKIFENLIKKITKADKWKLMLYVNHQLVKTIYVTEDERPAEKEYPCTVWFKYNIFKSMKVRVVLKPIKLLYSNNDKMETHMESVLYEGVGVIYE